MMKVAAVLLAGLSLQLSPARAVSQRHLQGLSRWVWPRAVSPPSSGAEQQELEVDGPDAKEAEAAVPHMRLPPLSAVSVSSIPMQRYSMDCWQKRYPVALAAHMHSQTRKAAADVKKERAAAKTRKAKKALHKKRKAARKAQNSEPGAGIDLKGIEPFTTVLADGFFEVDCIKDSMYYFGDKFGDHADEYNLADRSNVSIVLYSEHVAKEDKNEMTHEVCFEFCRTVPNMTFFGLVNGRDCYCTPYFNAMAGDSTECDSVCDGKKTQMCGGKHKSSIFEMHQCANTVKNLEDADESAGEAEEDLSEILDTVELDYLDMQSMGEFYQHIFGEAGDPATSNLMQGAKKFAGELHKVVTDGKALSGLILQAKDAFEEMKEKDFTKLENANKAENLTKAMEKLTSKALGLTEDLEEFSQLASPEFKELPEGTAAPGSQFFPIMYFVDKDAADFPTTCTGDEVEGTKPIVGVDFDGCARACNEEVHTCVGFMHFPVEEESEATMCFLFSKFKSVTYYTGCMCTEEGICVEEGTAEEKGSGFLEMHRKKAGGTGARPRVVCAARFSSFSGTTLAPDASGQCPGCLKKATKANRCYATVE